MSYVEAVYSIWLREFKVFTREKERAVSSVVTPIIWLVAFGAGLGSAISIGDTNYQTFIFPGILGMNVLFTSMFYGMYIVWDKKMDLLKEMLIAPVPRYVVFIGKALGGLTNVLFQMIILLVVGALFMGIPLNIASFILTLASALMLGFVCVCLGLFIGSKLSSPDAFSLIMSFVMWPMFLTSGALYPISNLPSYLQAVVQLNPMAYGVDLMRGVILGSFTFGFWLDVAVLALAGLAVFFVGQRSFDKMSLG